MRILGLAALLVFVVAAFTPVSNWLNAWMAGPARIEPADAIVVLGRGGTDSDGVLTNRSLRRLMHGIELYRKRLSPLLVLSGTGEETGARAVLAEGLGVPAAVIMQVSSVHTTREEAERIRELLLPRGQRRILLVSDPIDMPRTRAVMERAGFTVLPAPTAATGPSLPEGRLGLLRDIATELGGLAYHRITGQL
ncbi:MAG TPA: YdcF family protein [Methylomirabilota bacterium]|nr:YdcF family protein [Methylomirabilota bacterium]